MAAGASTRSRQHCLAFAGLVAMYAWATPAHAQSETFTGQLVPGDQRYDTGEYFDRYTVPGAVGRRVQLELRSTDFDTYLAVKTPSGDSYVNDDFESDDHRSVLNVRTDIGEYEIFVTSAAGGETGEYSLTLLVTDEAPAASEIAGEFVYIPNEEADEAGESDVILSPFDLTDSVKTELAEDRRVNFSNHAAAYMEHSSLRVFDVIAANRTYTVLLYIEESGGIPVLGVSLDIRAGDYGPEYEVTLQRAPHLLKRNGYALYGAVFDGDVLLQSIRRGTDTLVHFVADYPYDVVRGGALMIYFTEP